MIFTTLLLAALHATPAPGANVQSEPYMHAQRLVDIGDGRRLNIYCIGAGSPAVIFDSDAEVGSGTLPWSRVQPAVARMTRTCSYDRAGYGFSDPGPLPRTSDAIVGDLRTLLQRAGVPPPYLLVAHGIAGLYASLFAARYPNDVAGMVLVDPSTAGEEELLSTEYPKYAANEQQRLATMRDCGDDPTRKQCLQTPGPHALAPAAWRDPASELASIGEDGAELDSALHGYGAMPILILTALDESKKTEASMGATSAEVASVQGGWTALHDQLAAQSTRGADCVIAGAGHAMQIDKPEVVIDAIRQIMTLIPTEEKPSCAAWPSPRPSATPH
ncbi:MAG TPA: alpha/beta hydrolase [Candidatus Acidoferrales bacterium]|nr:alpha/beta hydrolase [Candidatus Acidoferrales bacterium]